MKKVLFFFVLIGMALSFAACNDERDGDWHPMEWSGYSKNKDIVVNVPVEGGTTVLHCKNYSGFLLYSVVEQYDTTYKTYDENDSTFDVHHVVTGSADIQCSGAQLQVTMKRNDSGMGRVLYVNVTAGDVVDKLRFTQAAK